jgi:fructoselysine 6-phosphate deglycase
MKELEQYVQRELIGADRYFAVADAGDELSALLRSLAEPARRVADELGTDATNIYLVGAGGSLANLLPLKQIFDRLLNVPVETYAGYALAGQEPSQLGPGSLVFIASNSGEVEDSLTALRFAKARDARVVAVVGKSGSTLEHEADATLYFHDWDEPVMVPALLVGLRLAENAGDAGLARELRDGLAAVPDVLRRVVPPAVEGAGALATEYLSCTHLTVLGAGALAGLAYKLAYNIVMENVRIAASFIEATEYRHGPCEALERTRPDMLFLVGTDWSREQTLRTLEACRRGGARTLVYDAADCGDLHPWLASLVLYPMVEPFIIQSAVQRGIVSLEPRAHMGGRGLYAFEKK